jgi:hypothetical protein
MAFRKIEAGLVHADVDDFIGKQGTIFYDNGLGDFRISDGVTPGGIALSFGGGNGGTYTLPTATTTVKGGVKIDGSTITIANQVISIGTVPYSSISDTPTIPTNTNQLTNGAAYITSSALTGLATETYVTTRGYLTTVAYADITNKPTLFSGSYVDLTNKPTIPTDINQLADASGLLGQGGGGGGTTYITNTVESPYSFSIAGDDSTLREIASGESIKISGSGGITVTTDAEGNVTITGTPVSLAGYATESYVTSQGYITASALTGYALSTAIPTNNNQLTNGSGYITGLSWDQLTNKPNLAGTYSFNIAADDSTLREISADETVKFIGASGITTASDAEGNITITGPNLSSYALTTAIPTNNNQLTNGSGYITTAALTGLATESFVTTRGYLTSLSWDELTNKPNLAGTYSWSIAADDSTQVEISAGNLVKIKGAGGITTSSDAEGNITITGEAPDRLTSNARSAVLNSNGTFSLPTMTSAPTSPQAGQMALADGTSWDPIAQNNGAPYMVIYTGTAWIGMGGVTADQVYTMILEMT